MNSEQAQEQVIQTFFEIKKSGPIYRGDNQDIFNCIGPVVRRKFEATRHHLSKASLKGKLDKKEAIQMFEKILPESKKS